MAWAPSAWQRDFLGEDVVLARLGARLEMEGGVDW